MIFASTGIIVSWNRLIVLLQLMIGGLFTEIVLLDHGSASRRWQRAREGDARDFATTTRPMRRNQPMLELQLQLKLAHNGERETREGGRQQRAGATGADEADGHGRHVS